MKTLKTSAALAAAILASAGLLAACDKSAQSADGATGPHEAGTAAYTPDGKVVQTGASDKSINAPAETVTAAPAGADGTTSTDTSTAEAPPAK